MSIRVMNEVWESRKFEGNQLLLLLALADFASDDGGNVFPSVEKMAEKTRASRRTVQRNLRKLEDEGMLIEVRPASQRFPAEYRIRPGSPTKTPQKARGVMVTPKPLRRIRQKNPSTRASARARERVIREEFDNWYQHYPKKVSRGAAEGPFGKARVDGGVGLEILIEATKHYAAQMAGKDSQYIKHPATWLNGKCWLDEPGPQSQTGLTWWQKRHIDERARGERYGEEVDLGTNWVQ